MLLQLTINFISAACVRVFNVHKTSLIMIYYLSINKCCMRAGRRESSRIVYRYNIIEYQVYLYIIPGTYVNYNIVQRPGTPSCIIFLTISNQFKYYTRLYCQCAVKLIYTEDIILIQLRYFAGLQITGRFVRVYEQCTHCNSIIFF